MNDNFLKYLSSIYQNPISCLGDDLSNLIAQAPFSAHLRDVQTNQYVQCNEFSRNNIGLDRCEDIIGLASRDVIYHRLKAEEHLGASEPWKQKLLELLDKTYELSNRILVEKVPAIQRDIELSMQGFIRITQTIRSPVFDSKNKVVAIASLDCDFVDKCELTHLFGLYNRYLPLKKAILNFLSYLKIDSFFVKMPTQKELLVLLSMVKNPASKYVSQQLKISTRTVDEYKNRLSNKLLNTNLTKLLIQLRTRNECNTFW